MSDGDREERRGAGPPPGAEPSPLQEVLEGAPGLARIAADTGWRGARALARAYRRAGSRLLAPGGVPPETASAPPPELSPAEALRRRGEELLRQSADVDAEEDSHPAYMRILDVLAPDEARILRFLARGGAQPSVDVRAGLPLASELIAQGQTMIAEEAGCRHGERIHAYLDNLHRLGLIWFSRESLRDSQRYLVLEAQPEVVEALEDGGRTARTMRRSIVLTPFGTDFCEACLPLGEGQSGPERPR